MSSTPHTVQSKHWTKSRFRCRLRGIILRMSDTFAADSLEAYIEQSFPDLRRTGYWYALEIDGNCNVTAAWVSKQPLTESELQPIDVQEQRRLMESFTHKDEVIGYYRAE